jgi:hypothetical protein
MEKRQPTFFKKNASRCILVGFCVLSQTGRPAIHFPSGKSEQPNQRFTQLHYCISILLVSVFMLVFLVPCP